MADSAWFVGAITIPAQSFTVTAAPASVAAGTYYLRHTTAGLSLIDAFAAAVVAAAGGTCSVAIGLNRRASISLNANRTITWGTAAILRDLLGFSQGDLTPAADSFTADSISPLLWSPGYLATPKTIAGVAGYSVDHKSRYKSDDGSRSETELYGEETWQDLAWTHIVPERLRVEADEDGGGTFHEFYEQCAKRGYPFHYYEAVTEEDDEPAAVSWPSSFGPYKLRGDTGDWYRRNQPNAELSSPLELELHIVTEVT